MFPSPGKIYKGLFPFRLSTTSYIYPSSYTTNVKLLAPHFDEIELLFFQSRPPESIPSPETINELVALASIHNLIYNIHLPLDISLADPNFTQRSNAIEVIKKIIGLTAPLNVSTYTLHLSRENDLNNAAERSLWLEYIHTGIKELFASGIRGPQITVENLDYPLDLLEGVITDLDLSVCLDMGHALKYGYDPATIYQQFKERIKMIHLHGVENNKDHLPLNKIKTKGLRKILKMLRGYEETISIEVFSLRDLEMSLNTLETLWPL